MKTNTYIIVKSMLMHEDKFTYQTIGDELNISSKTIRNQLSKIEAILSEHNIKLLKQSGVGLQIIGEKKDVLECYNFCNSNLNVTEISSDIRKNVLIYLLLTKQSKITIGFLENLFFITRPSIYNDLKDIENYFNEFDIKIIKSRKNGIEIITGEKRRRKCLLDYSTKMFEQKKDNYSNLKKIMSWMDYLYNNEENHNRTYIQNFISNIENYASFKITKIELDRMINWFLISIDRIKTFNYVNLDLDLKNKIRNKKIIEYIENNKKYLENKFNITLNESEIIYLASLLSSNVTSSFSSVYEESLNPKNLFSIIKEFCDELDNPICFFDKVYFENKFLPYLEKYIQKLNFEYDLYNPLTQEIKAEYSKLYKLSKNINPILNKYNLKEFDESGLATLTLLLADIMEMQIKTLKVYYILKNNIFEDDLNIHILKNNLTNVEIITDDNIENYDKDDIDLIISHEEIKKINTPVFVYPSLITQNFLKILKLNVEEIVNNKEKQVFK